MYETYAVLAIDKENGKLIVDKFGACGDLDTRRCFRACYRHGDYKILSVVRVPEKEEL